jgi:hypothetical protein
VTKVFTCDQGIHGDQGIHHDQVVGGDEPPSLVNDGDGHEHRRRQHDRPAIRNVQKLIPRFIMPTDNFRQTLKLKKIRWFVFIYLFI